MLQTQPQRKESSRSVHFQRGRCIKHLHRSPACGQFFSFFFLCVCVCAPVISVVFVSVYSLQTNANRPTAMWKLVVDRGRQTWECIAEEEALKLNRIVENHLLTKKSNDPNCRHESEVPEYPEIDQAVEKAVEFYSSIQTEDGHWAGDYGGPMFLLPGLMISCHSTGVELPIEHRREIIRYLTNQQHKDGGWGLHVEGRSTIFGTAMNYVAMRIAGVEASDERMQNARDFLHARGGAMGIPSWGKFWLSTLGVYEWEGMNPVPPELWWLPSWLPFHPSRFWCHCRVVYLPMAYIYGRKARAPWTPFIEDLRSELYPIPYSQIDWPSLRNYCHPVDLYLEHSWLVKISNAVLCVYEKIHNKTVREKALECCIDHIDHEDETTKYIDIGPVNKVVNMLCVYYAHGPDSEQFKAHVPRLFDYLWLSDDGMKMQGYNGSQLWDTAFAVQAIIDTGFADRFQDCLVKANDYVDISQVLEDVDNCDKYYRHISKGAWPFSTRDHGWPISDCTSEGLKAALKLSKLSFIESPILADRLYDAVNVCLSMQNTNGGWATYELTRGGRWLELLNPAEVFGDIMIDYPYVECTSASVQALHSFQESHPDHRSSDIKRAIEKGMEFIKSIQRPDGSWYGSWGVCFTYGTWFGLEALAATGEYYHNSEASRKACEFILSKQMVSGGWGETFESSVTHEYQQKDWAQIINTSWALLGLMRAQCPNRDAIDAGIQLLLRRQLPNGDFPQEAISGVFNANCMITYTNYRNIFPIWALGVYRSYYRNAKL